MFGLEYLAAGMLYLTPTPVLAKVECHAKTAPKIIVKPSKSRVKYDFSRSKAQLNRASVDTISPYGPQHTTNVSGLMSGTIQTKQKIGFMHEVYEQLGQGCIYLQSVNVTIHIDPTIYIAKEHPRGSCMHNAVLAHERKHVKEDQLIVNKYSSKIDRALRSLVSSREWSVFGPFQKERMSFIQDDIKQSIIKTVRNYNDDMNNERRRRQQAIDTLEEYESIGAKCKNRKK